MKENKYILNHLLTSGSSLDGWGGGEGGGGLKRGETDCGRGRPGEVREGGTPSALLGGMGEHWKLPHRGLGRSPRNQLFLRWKTLQNYADPAFIFSMRRTTVHSFRKYDNDGKIHYTDTADTDDSLLTTLTDADCDVPNREKWSKETRTV